jgi:hypothetical protein
MVQKKSPKKIIFKYFLMQGEVLYFKSGNDWPVTHNFLPVLKQIISVIYYSFIREKDNPQSI